MSFSAFEFTKKKKVTRWEKFLARMEEIVTWKGLVALIEPYSKENEGDRRWGWSAWSAFCGFTFCSSGILQIDKSSKMKPRTVKYIILLIFAPIVSFQLLRPEMPEAVRPWNLLIVALLGVAVIVESVIFFSRIRK